MPKLPKNGAPAPDPKLAKPPPRKARHATVVRPAPAVEAPQPPETQAPASKSAVPVLRVVPPDGVRDDAPPALTPQLAVRERARLLAVAVADMNERYAVGQVGGGVYVIAEGEDDTGRPTHNLMKEADLKLLLSNRPLRLPHITRGGAVERRDECRATAWLKHENRRTVARVVFAPGESIDPAGPVYNLWKGWGLQPVYDDGEGCKLIRALVHDVLCSGDTRLSEWIHDWCAQLVQFPQEKPGTALVLRGPEGVGKGTFAVGILGRIMGAGFLHVSSSRFVTGHFNSCWQATLLGFADEAVWAGDKAAEGALKALITEPSLLIEHKGKNAFPIVNHARLIFASNEGWVVPAGKSARRFAVTDVAGTYANNGKYFRALREEMDAGGVASYFGWLLRRKITADLRVGPVTEALLDQKLQSLDSVSGWWHERLWTGELGGVEDHTADGFPTTIAASRLFASYHVHCKRTGERYPASEEQVARRLREFAEINVSRPRSAIGPRERVYNISCGNPDEKDHLAGMRGRFEKWIGGALAWEGEGKAALIRLDMSDVARMAALSDEEFFQPAEGAPPSGDCPF